MWKMIIIGGALAWLINKYGLSGVITWLALTVLTVWLIEYIIRRIRRRSI